MTSNYYYKHFSFIWIILFLIFIVHYYYKKVNTINIGYSNNIKIGKTLNKNFIEGFKFSIKNNNYRINGKKINFIAKNNNDEIMTNKNIMTNFLNKNIHFIIENSNQNLVFYTSQQFKNKDKTLFITNTPITSYNLSENFLEISEKNYWGNINNLLKYFKNNSKKIAIIYDKENFFINFICRKIENEFKNKNISMEKIYFDESFNAIRNKILKSNFDTILFSSTNIQKFNFNKIFKFKKNIIFLNLPKEIIPNKNINLVNFYPRFLNGEKYYNFIKLYKFSHNRYPNNEVLMGYITGNLFKKACKKCGFRNKKCIKKFIKEELKKIKSKEINFILN